MGDYYKIKKILLILIIVLTILRIFKTSNVFASEAVEVTPTWNDGSYTNQSDNNYLTLQTNQIKIQERIIMNIWYNYSNSPSDEKKQRIFYILQRIANLWDGSNSRFAWFFNDVSGTGNWGYQEVTYSKLTSNIVFNDATLNDGYKITNVPFYSFSRDGSNQVRIFNSDFTPQSISGWTGTALIPCAEIGAYSTKWLELFQFVGLINNTNDYESILSSIEETNELNYTQNLYTKQAVQNTYSYLTNDNIEEITSLGISQPEVTEQVDLTDVLDSLEALLTNETYTTKFFTITLPNGRGSTFALSPELLENNLNRVGGQNIVSIIHAVWYIGLYGWYIFSLLGIYGKLLTGDLFHLVKGCSPVTNLVKMSVGTISGGKF